MDALVEACRKGESRAQLTLYDRYYKAMYNTAFRIVGHSAEAEDILQESFLNAFTRIDSFRGEVTFGAWLKRIVVNQSIQRYHQLRRVATVDVEEVMYRVEDADAYTTEEDSPAESKAQKVLQAMNQLKENYRIALTLYLIEGYDYEEIGAIMGLSYANCRTTISRAKEKLRTLLNASML